MATSTGFVAPATPECSYAPRMTRAQALALRTAGTLNENCHVVITDGPTIGVAPNTSVTEIELHPTSPTAFGLEAKVKTTFDNSAWDGLYDIDLGAAGSIIQLTDNQGNTVKDVDADAPTVQTQFPWSNVNYRDNYVEDSVLTGWATQVGLFTNNRVIESTVNLTGKTAGLIQTTEFINTSVVLGSAGASVAISDSKIRRPSGLVNIQINHTGTGPIVMTGTDIADNYSIQHGGTGAATLNLLGGNYFHGHRTGAGNQWDVDTTGSTGNFFVQNSELIARTTAATQFIHSGASGAVSVTNSRVDGGAISKLSGNLLSIADSEVLNQNTAITVAVTAGSSAQLQIGTSIIIGGVYTLAGAGSLQITGCQMNGCGISTSATSVRGLALTTSQMNGQTITQNRTGGVAGPTNQDQAINCLFFGFGGFPITINGAVDPGGAQVLFNFCHMESACTITITDPGVGINGVLFQSTRFGGASSVTSPAGGLLVQKSRFDNGCTVNVGAFTHASLIIEGSFTKTLTANNTNRLCNKSFDDTI